MKKGNITLSGNQIIESGNHEAIFTESAVFIKLYGFENEVEPVDDEPEIIDDTAETPKKETVKKETAKKESKKETPKKVVEETPKAVDEPAKVEETTVPEDEDNGSNLSKFKKGEYKKIDITELKKGDKIIWVAPKDYMAEFTDYLVEVLEIIPEKNGGGVRIAGEVLVDELEGADSLVIGEVGEALIHEIYLLNVKL